MRDDALFGIESEQIFESGLRGGQSLSDDRDLQQMMNEGQSLASQDMTGDRIYQWLSL